MLDAFGALWGWICPWAWSSAWPTSSLRPPRPSSASRGWTLSSVPATTRTRRPGDGLPPPPLRHPGPVLRGTGQLLRLHAADGGLPILRCGGPRHLPPLRYMNGPYDTPDLGRYRDQIREILRLAIDSGRGMEINTWKGQTLAQWIPPPPGLQGAGGEILTVGLMPTPLAPGQGDSGSLYHDGRLRLPLCGRLSREKTGDDPAEITKEVPYHDRTGF